MLAAVERERIADGKSRLPVVDACPIGERAEADPAADVAIAANVYLTQVRNLCCERVLDPELLVGEVRDRIAVVPVAEEPAPELVDHVSAEHVNVGQREGPLVRRFFAFVTSRSVAVGEGIA